MPTTQQVIEIVDKVKKRLADAERDGIYLKVSGAVETGCAGVRARQFHVKD